MTLIVKIYQIQIKDKFKLLSEIEKAVERTLNLHLNIILNPIFFL